MANPGLPDRVARSVEPVVSTSAQARAQRVLIVRRSGMSAPERASHARQYGAGLRYTSTP
ncbi:hypothetical protein HC891_07360 [Candidatus Gracilibacteria bacterium]|nr:hypothetical protein [Candidatus Gracilibacteria bacterium]